MNQEQRIGELLSTKDFLVDNIKEKNLVKMILQDTLDLEHAEQIKILTHQRNEVDKQQTILDALDQQRATITQQQIDLFYVVNSPQVNDLQRQINKLTCKMTEMGYEVDYLSDKSTCLGIQITNLTKQHAEKRIQIDDI